MTDGADAIIGRALGDPGALHHAYLIAGRRAAAERALRAYLAERLSLASDHPDLAYFSFDALGVDESREVGALASRRAALGGRKAFIIAANSVTREAQNAFLKVFEEPVPGTHLFLIVPSVAMIIPTLRSRLSVIELPIGDEGDADGGPAAFARAFRDASLPERMKMAKTLAAEISDEEKSRADALEAASELERIVAREERDEARAAFLSDTMRFKRDLSGRSASIKMIFEHLALSLPSGRPAPVSDTMKRSK